MSELPGFLDLGGTDIFTQHSTEMRSKNISALTIPAPNVQTQVQIVLNLIFNQIDKLELYKFLIVCTSTLIKLTIRLANSRGGFGLHLA